MSKVTIDVGLDIHVDLSIPQAIDVAGRRAEILQKYVHSCGTEGNLADSDLDDYKISSIERRIWPGRLIRSVAKAWHHLALMWIAVQRRPHEFAFPRPARAAGSRGGSISRRRVARVRTSSGCMMLATSVHLYRFIISTVAAVVCICKTTTNVAAGMATGA